MGTSVRRALAALLGVGLALGGSAAPAAARPTARESFKGTIVTSGASGTRTVLSTMLVAQGVFNGVGRIVEVPNRSGDPDNVVRDDLVFRRGAMHLLSTSQAPKISFDLQTCSVSIRIRQTAQVQGGTRRFRHATGTFSGSVHGWGVARRNADGSCNQQADLVLEVDVVSAHGTISF